MFKEMTQQSSSRRGFTLLEIIVGAFILTLVFVMLFKLFMGGTRAMEYGTWYSNSVTQMKIGLRKLREDIGKANFPTVLNPTSVDDSKSTVPQYFFKFANGTTTLGAGNVTLMEFYICKPARNLPADTRPGQEIVCKLEARGKNLHYSKTGAGVNAEELSDGNKIFIQDVEKVEIKVRDMAAGSGADIRSMCDFTVTCAHPVQTNKKASETTSARVSISHQP
jgi:hypothetical protein